MAFKFKDLMNYSAAGPGVPKRTEDDKKRFRFTKFFVLTVRKFWKLVSMNLLYVFMNLPILAGVLALTGNFDHPFVTPARQFYPILYGVSKFTMNPSIAALFGINGQMIESGYASVTTNILWAVCALVILTFGLSNTGMAYVMRNFAREEHADVGDDFFYTVKRNWKQALLVGILDSVAIVTLFFDVTYFYYLAFHYSVDTGSAFGWQLIFFAMVLVTLTYCMMRLYMYILLVTFDLKTMKLIKNSFILALLGVKRNVMALLGILLVVFINYFFYMMFPPIGITMPFILTFALTGFIAAYAAYPNIKRYMIDPFYPDADKPLQPDENSIFKDRG